MVWYCLYIVCTRTFRYVYLSAYLQTWKPIEPFMTRSWVSRTIPESISHWVLHSDDHSSLVVHCFEHTTEWAWVWAHRFLRQQNIAKHVTTPLVANICQLYSSTLIILIIRVSPTIRWTWVQSEYSMKRSWISIYLDISRYISIYAAHHGQCCLHVEETWDQTSFPEPRIRFQQLKPKDCQPPGDGGSAAVRRGSRMFSAFIFSHLAKKGDFCLTCPSFGKRPVSPPLVPAPAMITLMQWG